MYCSLYYNILLNSLLYIVNNSLYNFKVIILHIILKRLLLLDVAKNYKKKLALSKMGYKEHENYIKDCLDELNSYKI